MNKKNVIISLILIFCLVFIPSYTVFASGGSSPEQYNNELSDYAKEIENRYNINIEYPIRSDGFAAIGTATLATLETSLSYLSDSFVSQLSTYYKDNYGNKLMFEYTYLPKSYSQRDIAALGYFSSNECTIQLFIPTKGSDMVMTGNSPITILHEIGHAYHLFLTNCHGKDNLRNEWIKHNNGLNYGYFNHNPDRNIFMSFYSTMSYEEDFAETFAYTFSSNRPGLGISSRLARKDGTHTGLGEKIRLISRIIPTYLVSTESMISNLYKVYNTSDVLYYKGFYLTGNSLEYAGFNQPNGILDAILKSLKIKPVKTEWVRDVGGWKVSDKNNGIYLIFPGCGYVTLKKPEK